ncbi:MAG: hypothetical protein GY696_26270 [Gammaproteobacteria bacterium]|nr:hypothetical protein [Gammaproteobacteria bacterium]
MSAEKNRRERADVCAVAWAQPAVQRGIWFPGRPQLPSEDENNSRFSETVGSRSMDLPDGRQLGKEVPGCRHRYATTIVRHRKWPLAVGPKTHGSSASSDPAGVSRPQTPS